jgi:nucleoside-diphosphate-sugar epimerase
MTPRYLVTGAQGFVGRYFVVHLLDRFPQSIVLGTGRSLGQNSMFRHSMRCGDRTVQAPLPESLCNVDADRYSYFSIELSSARLAERIREFRPTAIIHLAASLRGVSEEIVLQNNIRSTEGLLSAIRASGWQIGLLLVASSGGVYGRPESLPISETAAVHPIDLYSRSKLASEDLARSFSVETGTPTAIARIFNVFGPGQDEFHFAGRMAEQVAAILSGKSPPLIQTGSLSSTRDFLDVRDVCSALSAVIERRFVGVCNIASGIETNAGHLLSLLLQAAGLQSTVEIQQETDRPDAIPRHFADISRLMGTGFAPQYSILQTCDDMLNYCTRLICAEHPE